jgi:spoIIIJ-associated protein
MTDHEPNDLTAEAEGSSLGEAKWNAVKQLEPRFPGVTADCVTFEVMDEGDEGSGAPARVRAALDEEAYEGVAWEMPEAPAERVRAVVSRVVAALGLRASVDIDESDEEIRATVNGDDLGLLIGRHGHTIDAVQYLANAILHRHEETDLGVVVDAQGYRARRERTLRDVAARAAADAVRTGAPVALEAMSSVERKIVHMYLKAEVPQVRTASEGSEPNRYVVVLPAESGETPEV